MSKDYRRGEQVPPPPTKVAQKRRPSRSCLWWFVMGAALGIFVGRFHLGMSDEPESGQAAKEQQAAPESPPDWQFEHLVREPAVDPRQKSRPLPPPAARPQPPAAVTQFPDQPEASVEPPRAVEPPPAPQTPPSTPGTYVVQIASVRRSPDAERLKAELALRGIRAHVEAATLSNGQTTYRIRLGPYPNRQAADQALAELRRRGKDGITYQVR